MEEELAKCRLCNYQSDKRLMLNIFDEPADYSRKIENYLNIKVRKANWEISQDLRKILN